MEANSYIAYGFFFRKVFQLLSVITLALSFLSTALPTSSQWNDSDSLSLLAIKSQIADPMGALSSWNDSLHHCEWAGITCSRRHHGRVTKLDLQSQKLGGTLSPYIGNLTFLFEIHLQKNNFHGVVPQEIGALHRLRYLMLSNNSFIGEIPSNLTYCSDLRNLFLNGNSFSGNILSVVSTFSRMIKLDLHVNNFSGIIPSSLGNLSSLEYFLIRDNHIQGSIPADLCRIPRLGFFDVGVNNLTGKIPSCLYNQSNIYSFTVAVNQLEGSLPSDVGFTLPKIRALIFFHNKLSGPLPTSLPNATNLQMIEFSQNYFSGPVATDLGRLQGLRMLTLYYNELGTRNGDDLRFINSLINCTDLVILEMGGNSLKGLLPASISNLSTKLTILGAEDNKIYGNLPSGLGNLVNLEIIQFQQNVLTGPVPASLGNLTRLTDFYVEDNKLDGSIPPTIGNCKNLLSVDFSRNKFIGTIPPQLFHLNLHTFYLGFSHNALTGFLPSQVSNLTKLQSLVLSKNMLSGHLPESLGNCLALETLTLARNFFEGEIPKSLTILKGLRYFDLSENNMSGEIPDYLGQLPLQYLNLSFNRLEGNVPNTGVFGNASAFSIDGNKNLCGGIRELKLPSCMQKGKKKSSPSIKVIFPVIVGSLCLLVFLCVLIICYRRKTLKMQSPSRTIFSLRYNGVSYGELLKATDGFSDENLIGVGSHGSVYKGFLQQINKTVAVKVIKLQIGGAPKSFIRECDVFRNIRHRNILKIITACSSVDFKGDDFKALIFDFMPNGSLDDWIHPKVDEQQTVTRFLTFIQRLNIAIDVAAALEYLHHHCQPSVVHCDVKPNNVLLDDDMTAHVADFGIAKMFAASSHDSMQSIANSVVIKGSIGYIAPEYGAGSEVSTQGDVYSYGILLLEMFTRKKPTDGMFVDGLSLNGFAKLALPDQVSDIIDPMILKEEIDVLNIVEQSETKGRLHGSLVSIIRMAATCSDGVPLKRMTISEVVVELQHIKDRYLDI